MKCRTLHGRRIISLFLAALCCAACTRTEYVELGTEETDLIAPLRHVGVKIDPAYTYNFPDCTIVLKPEARTALQALQPFVEETLARHLSRKMSRVIDANERELLARQNSLDLRHETDQAELANLSGCDTLLTSRIVGTGATSALVWSQIQVGIEAQMIRPLDEKIIWRARHIADRSKGGLPFSPLSAVMDAFSSLNFLSDPDVVESVIDDAIRRIVQSIPDGRVLESSSEQNDRS